MKIIILSASTGGGHITAANCVRDYLIKNGDEAIVVDTLEYISPILNKTVVEIYELLATKHPSLWKMIYNSTNKKTLNKVVFGTNNLISKKLIPLVNSQKPDVIISTHPFATEMISHLKSLNLINIPLICIMTDYAPHRTWISPNVDHYVIANDDMTLPMIDMGVPEDKIHSFGIPVDDDFFSKKDKKEELAKIGLNDDLPTILIMAGSCGFANAEKIFTSLQTLCDVDFQIIVITGKNKKLYENLERLIAGKRIKKIDKFFSKIHLSSFPIKHFKIIRKIRRNKVKVTKPTKLIFYTNEVNKYMVASDLIITKPGGLTVSEALACNLPMALFGAIPGQEEENENFLVNKNMAIKLNGSEDIASAIKSLILNPQKLNFLKSNCKNFDKSGCLKSIFELVHRYQRN